jgi:hypothetical protein
MSRHHNRAILSEITEKQLDPNKKYVLGKHGLASQGKNSEKENTKAVVVPEALIEVEKDNYDKLSFNKKDQQEAQAQALTTAELESVVELESTIQVSNNVEESFETDTNIKLETSLEKDNKKKKVIKKL